MAGDLAFVLNRNQAVSQARSTRIYVSGLAELRRAFKVQDASALRDLQRGLKLAVTPLAAEARALAPHRSGRLGASLKPFSAGNAFGVRSSLPQANVIHWGGTTGKGHRPGVPWSGSVRVKPSLFISRAIEQHEERIIQTVGDVIDQHARQLGWH